MVDGAIQIKYCQAHYDELMIALVDRQLIEYISQTHEELIEKLTSGKMDPALESSSAITGSALQLFGPEVILQHDGCPICTFNSIITHVADHMAVKYRKAN